jgi:hypothetical protein
MNRISLQTIIPTRSFCLRARTGVSCCFYNFFLVFVIFILPAPRSHFYSRHIASSRCLIQNQLHTIISNSRDLMCVCLYYSNSSSLSFSLLLSVLSPRGDNGGIWSACTEYSVDFGEVAGCGAGPREEVANEYCLRMGTARVTASQRWNRNRQPRNGCIVPA